MTAPTAAKIIDALARHRFQSTMAQLAQLDAEHADAVRAALSAVSRRARIDLGLLLRTVKSEIAARAEARRASADPARYEALLISQGYEPYRPGATPAPTSRQVPDEDQPRRRSVPRVRSRREVQQPDPPPKQKPKVKPEPFFFGGKVFGAGDSARPFGCPEGVDYDAWQSAGSARPPWLLDDSDEPDADLLDDDADDVKEKADAATSPRDVARKVDEVHERARRPRRARGREAPATAEPQANDRGGSARSRRRA